MASPLLEERAPSARARRAAPGLLLLRPTECALAQVVANLLTNAAQVHRPGGRIAVSAARERRRRSCSRARQRHRHRARDMLPRVFELFVQGRAALDRAAGRARPRPQRWCAAWSSCTAARVAAHSDGPGQAAASSSCGCRAAAAQPRRRRHRRVAPRRRGARRRRARAGRRRQRRRRRAARRALARASATRSRSRTTGRRRCDRCGAFKPDVAMLDIGLPVMDGYELARRLRADAAARAAAPDRAHRLRAGERSRARARGRLRRAPRQAGRRRSAAADDRGAAVAADDRRRRPPALIPSPRRRWGSEYVPRLGRAVEQQRDVGRR